MFKYIFEALLFFSALQFAPPQPLPMVKPSFHVEFGSRDHHGCSFVASPLSFCREPFTSAYEDALTKAPNFNEDMNVIVVNTRPEYKQQSVVALRRSTGEVFPLPFDFFSHHIMDPSPPRNGTLLYSLAANKICVVGEIMAYRSTQRDELCWQFDGKQFTGQITPYTYPDH